MGSELRDLKRHNIGFEQTWLRHAAQAGRYVERTFIDGRGLVRETVTRMLGTTLRRFSSSFNRALLLGILFLGPGQAIWTFEKLIQSAGPVRFAFNVVGVLAGLWASFFPFAYWLDYSAGSERTASVLSSLPLWRRVLGLTVIRFAISLALAIPVMIAGFAASGLLAARGGTIPLFSSPLVALLLLLVFVFVDYRFLVAPALSIAHSQSARVAVKESNQFVKSRGVAFRNAYVLIVAVPTFASGILSFADASQPWLLGIRPMVFLLGKLLAACLMVEAVKPLVSDTATPEAPSNPE